jgi:hypothetical protein
MAKDHRRISEEAAQAIFLLDERGIVTSCCDLLRPNYPENF